MNSTPSHRREPYRIPRARVSATSVVAWVVCALGLGLFVASFIASAAGVVLIPFDQHHFLGQVGGLLLAVTGVSVATRRR